MRQQRRQRRQWRIAAWMPRRTQQQRRRPDAELGPRRQRAAAVDVGVVLDDRVTVLDDPALVVAERLHGQTAAEGRGDDRPSRRTDEHLGVAWVEALPLL